MAGSLIKVATVLLMCMFVAQPFMVAEAAVTCATVAGAMRPCIPYLQNGGAVPAPCCGGVKSLLAAATTPKDRQTACSCLKTAAGSIKGINLSNAAGLPRACGVSIPYAISPNTNCATVK